MLLKKLTEANGISGNETEIRNLIKTEIAQYVDEMYTDVLGNLIAIKNKNNGKDKVMLAAHMDEVGLMVVNIEKNGLLKFRSVGGIDERILVSKHVLIGEDKVNGVIGAKAIHLQKPNERTIPLTMDQLYIDIGANSKEEAESKVKIGDYVAFASAYTEMGSKCVKGKAFDDRVGCAVLIEILKSNIDIPIYAAFTVQEEIGLRGASTATYSINPDLALVIEGTTASDVIGTKEHQYVTQLGKGPALSVIDRGMIANAKLNKNILKIADDNNIPIQIREGASGGNDAGKIHLHKTGVLTGVLSIPVRYIHSPHSLINLDDYENLIKLTKVVLDEVAKGGISST
ncbi:M42 family metallopeptidase [Desulfuribacillus alkaliarsenatis]|uniref:Peptidase M42 n=1 Tax=Desulfuribacillus alkaliarsenatis TaxID=766136 RepID=A0A1E5G6C6_9FIRM|nr:M42 family metallopeptidase [Desulfuribacillus alkaliarsenatis]OEF98713.1 peptidase M42 [Desulfuribacillus alkaliarsenatis]